MLLSRLAVAVVAFSLVEGANVKRQFGSVNSILNTLGKNVTQTSVKMDTLLSGETETNANMGTLSSQLSAALQQAADSLNALAPPSKMKRQSADDVSVAEASIISNVVTTLNGFTAAEISSLPTFIAQIDTAMANEVNGFHTQVANLSLTHKLLLELGSTIVADGFTKTAAALGGF